MITIRKRVAVNSKTFSLFKKLKIKGNTFVKVMPITRTLPKLWKADRLIDNRWYPEGHQMLNASNVADITYGNGAFGDVEPLINVDYVNTKLVDHESTHLFESSDDTPIDQ